jgi:hypothetical protein
LFECLACAEREGDPRAERGCILTGTRGAVAQTLVALGADLGPLTTLRNLKHGLRECIRLMSLENGRRAAAKPAPGAKS